MVQNAEKYASNIQKENLNLKQMLAQTQIYLNWVTEGSDFSKLPIDDLEKWQNVYATGLKNIAIEKGRREALNNHKTFQDEILKICALNNTLQTQINEVKKNMSLNESQDFNQHIISDQICQISEHQEQSE